MSGRRLLLRAPIIAGRQDDPSGSASPPADPVETPEPSQTPPPADPTPSPTTTDPPAGTPSTPPPGNPNPGNNNPGNSSPPPTPTGGGQPSVPTPIPTVGRTTDTNGNVDTVTYLITPTISTPSGAPTNPTNPDDSPGMKTGTIVGLSIAGGVALLGIIAFVVWKWRANRNKFNEFDPDAIKWPELKQESHALPARSTGSHGVGLDDEVGAAYGSDKYSQGHSYAASTSQLLPASGYPPTTVSHGYSDSATIYSDHLPPGLPPVAGAYADPHAGSMRSRSPGPVVAMGGRHSPGPSIALSGRQSPGPGVAYSGRQSPGPGVMYGGRTSPGPGAAYGGRTSPGPGPAYGGFDPATMGGRQSPGPGMAYGPYDPPMGGRQSPGPNAAYGGYR